MGSVLKGVGGFWLCVVGFCWIERGKSKNYIKKQSLVTEIVGVNENEKTRVADEGASG
jgi:hypothetical protein|tara:strand:+ start:660 stop:833 length:174 start_codon:yes stop_codon:yes gene_type:complete